MRRLPLLIGARPRFIASKRGPLVPLGGGDWNIIGDHKDSQISIDCITNGISVLHPLNGSPVNVKGYCNVQIVIITPGDKTLDFYAETK